jgi:hypothetical protein
MRKEEQLSFQSPQPVQTASTESKLDDSAVVARMLPDDWEVGDFVPKADYLLTLISTQGLDHVDGEHRAFLNSAFKPFLERLAYSQQPVAPTSRRGSRHRVALA